MDNFLEALLVEKQLVNNIHLYNETAYPYYKKQIEEDLKIVKLVYGEEVYNQFHKLYNFAK